MFDQSHKLAYVYELQAKVFCFPNFELDYRFGKAGPGRASKPGPICGDFELRRWG